jgi:hypothetical protein
MCCCVLCVVVAEVTAEHTSFNDVIPNYSVAAGARSIPDLTHARVNFVGGPYHCHTDKSPSSTKPTAGWWSTFVTCDVMAGWWSALDM